MLFRSFALFIFIFSLSILYPNFSRAQVSGINCCGVFEIIPQFNQTSADLLNVQYAVKEKIIPPINTSESDIEIRLYRYCTLGGAMMVDIIKSRNDSLIAERFAWQDTASKRNPNRGVKPKYILFLNHAPMHLTKYHSWKSFFDALTANHFFILPGQDELNKEVLKNNPAILVGGIGDGCRTVFEIKLNNSYRVTEIKNAFFPEPKTVPDYIYLQKISAIFNDLQLTYGK